MIIMRNFTKYLLTGLCIVVAFMACNKTTVKTTTVNATTPFMKLAYNNTNLSLNTCVALQNTVNGSKQLVISAYNTTNNQVTSDSSFEIALYQNIDSIKAGQIFSASTVFEQPNSASLFFFTDSVHSYQTQIAQPIGSVTITAVTASQVRGTFSGGLFNSNDVNASTLIYTINNGSFTAKRQ